MSKISRSVYQKVVEENRKLKRDIRIMTMDETVASVECMMKWYDHFQEENDINQRLKEAALRYIKEHKNELPNFITNKIE